jgi:tetratricopeptide (TPR) repeat protein
MKLEPYPSPLFQARLGIKTIINMSINHRSKKHIFVRHVHPNPFTCKIIGTTLVILIVQVLALNHTDNVSYASGNKRSLEQGDKKNARANHGPMQFRQYRQRVVERMASEDFLKRIWRSHRSYPYLQRAIDLSLENRYAEALSIYDTYLIADPKHLLMQWNRLVLLDTLKNSPRIEKAASDFLGQVPGFGPVLILRALARKDMQCNDKAEADWKAALQDTDLTVEDRCRVMSEIVSSTYQRKAYLESLHWCDGLMQIKPPTMEDMIFRAGLLEKLRQWQEAQDQWQLVIDQKPAPVIRRRAILAEAVLLQKNKKNQAAVAILSKAQNEQLFNSPDVPQPQREAYYLLLAQLAEQSSRIDLACHCYQKLMDSGLEDTKRFSLARLYAIDNREKKIMPLLFEQPAVSLNNTEALKRMLDLVYLLVRKKKSQLATDLLNKSLPKAKQNYYENKADQDAKWLWVQYLAAISTINGYRNDHRQAESTLAQLSNITGQYQYQMDYATVLIANGKTEEALKVLASTVKRDDLSSQNRAQANAAMASAFGKIKHFKEEARAWNQAYVYENDPIYRLYCIQAWHKAGDPQAVANIVQDFSVVQLSTQEQVAWYETAAHAWRQIGDLNKSKAALQKAASLKPCPLYYCQISDILVSQGDIHGAEAAVEKALEIDPQHPNAMERLAYIKVQQGNNEKAAMLFERLKEIGWDKYQTSADLGFTYARMGKNKLAYQNLVNGVDKVLSENSSDAEENAEKQAALSHMRHQITEIDNNIELLIADSFQSLNNADGVLKLPSSTQWFNMGVGMIELGFRPPKIGYNSGRTLTLFSRMMWPNRSDSISPKKDTLQAGLGFKYKPFNQTNLLFSAEQLFGLGDEIEDRPLLRIAHSATRMPCRDENPQELSLFSSYLPYRQFYTDIGKEFGNQNSLSISHETRLGNDLSGKDNRSYLLFGYLQGNAMKSDDEDFAQVQAGMGISLQWLGAFDRYKGYRREAELLLRCGYVAYDSNDDMGLSTLLGVRVSFY